MMSQEKEPLCCSGQCRIWIGWSGSNPLSAVGIRWVIFLTSQDYCENNKCGLILTQFYGTFCASESLMYAASKNVPKPGMKCCLPEATEQNLCSVAFLKPLNLNFVLLFQTNIATYLNFPEDSETWRFQTRRKTSR